MVVGGVNFLGELFWLDVGVEDGFGDAEEVSFPDEVVEELLGVFAAEPGVGVDELLFRVYHFLVPEGVASVLAFLDEGGDSVGGVCCCLCFGEGEEGCVIAFRVWENCEVSGERVAVDDNPDVNAGVDSDGEV
jgi:hypothetical protein